MQGSSCVRSDLDKNYQEEWQIIMMINTAGKFSSGFLTTWKEDLYRLCIGIYRCWWLFLLIMGVLCYPVCLACPFMRW